MASKIAELTEELVTPILHELQLELVDVQYVKEGKNWFLRVFIDSDTGIDLDKCALVSEKLSASLDAQDPVKDAYFLEVSSAGAERPLKKREDYTKALNKYVRITTYEPINGEKAFEGKLNRVTEDTVTLTMRIKTVEKEIEIPFDKIASSRLAIVFN